MNTQSSPSIAFSLLFLPAFCATSGANASQEDNRSAYLAPEATTPMIVDGLANETDWQAADWRELDQRWLGPQYRDDDGSEKLADDSKERGWIDAGLFGSRTLVD